MKFYYFEQLPLELVRPSGITMDSPKLQDPNFFNVVFGDWNKLYQSNILEDLGKNGQLNPNLSTRQVTDTEWKIEPGQSRWYALYKLGIKTQKVIFVVKPELENNFYENFLKPNVYKYKGINNREQLTECFQSTSWEDRHGLGFFRRKYSEYF